MSRGPYVVGELLVVFCNKTDCKQVSESLNDVQLM